MKNDIITVILLIIFFYPILKGFLIKFSSSHIKDTIDSITSSILFLIAIFFSMFIMKNIFLEHENEMLYNIYINLPEKLIALTESRPILVYLVGLPICVILSYIIFKVIVGVIYIITIYPILDNIEENLDNKSNSSKRIMGSLFGLPKGLSYILIVTFLLNFVSILNISVELNESLEKSPLYNGICQKVVIPITHSNIAKKLPGVINNSFTIVTKNNINSEFNNSNVIIYYNGVTIDEGIKSNQEIDDFAIELVKDENEDINKAKIIYNWISDEIEYDTEKAEKIMTDDFDVESGTINTFNTREGICFDYACLYASMCRANDIGVRIITGQGFNGQMWVNHAWNQVYISEDDTWINVDATFSIGGDYFNSSRFKIDHKQEGVAGEWR